jgi:hypothetical protein
MKISLLHISDLLLPIQSVTRRYWIRWITHRRRYTAEEDPPIRSPDLIIVSGDIVQGIRPSEPDPENALKQQYDEAFAFLNELASRFVAGIVTA